jgi:hypothetical protein
MVRSKLTCPKWYFGQVGHGGKKNIGGFFLLKFLVKKIGISCTTSSMLEPHTSGWIFTKCFQLS